MEDTGIPQKTHDVADNVACQVMFLKFMISTCVERAEHELVNGRSILRAEGRGRSLATSRPLPLLSESIISINLNATYIARFRLVQFWKSDVLPALLHLQLCDGRSTILTGATRLQPSQKTLLVGDVRAALWDHLKWVFI